MYVVQKYKDYLVLLGFDRSKANPSLFINLGDDTICILVYVDNMVIRGSNQHEVNELIKELRSKFSV